jgi:hypothetical protein
MQPLNHDLLASNAFRTLGLSAAATQADVDRAARKMRIFPDPAMIPPTPWDLPALGNVSRTKNDVEQAVSRLNEPQSRVQERLLWFHTELATRAGPSPEALDSLCSRGDKSPDPAARHDSALAALHAAMLLDPFISDEARWQRAIGGFAKLAASEEYRQLLHRTETEGDFEKRAEPHEIDLSISALPDTIAGSLVVQADRAMDDGDFAGCGRILRVLSRSGSVELQYRVLDRVEDALQRRCRQLHDEMARRLITDRDNFLVHTQTNRKLCLESAHFYNDTISPLLTELETLCAQDQDRGTRSRGMGAKSMSEIALAWVWAGDFITAESTYAAALQLATETSLEPAIRADMEENADRARRQRQGARISPATQPARTLGYTWTTQKPKSGKSRASWGWIVAVIMGLRLIAAMTGSLTSRSSTPVTTPNFTIPSMPQYTVPTIPNYTPDAAPNDPNNPGVFPYEPLTSRIHPDPNSPRHPQNPPPSDKGQPPGGYRPGGPAPGAGSGTPGGYAPGGGHR